MSERAYACAGCGKAFIQSGLGRSRDRCDPCRRAKKTADQRARRAVAGQARTEAGADPFQSAQFVLGPVDPEPSKVQGDYRAHHQPAANNQWARRGKIPLDLTGCPLEDLPAARIWVMRHCFGLELYSWQRRDMQRLGGHDRPTQAYWQLGRKNGKSLFACALILTDLVLVPESAVFAVSDSERNLNSAMVRELKQLIARSVAADRAFIVTQSRIEYPHNGSFFEVRPNKFAATQSINPTMVVMDEVHLQKSDEVWNGFVLAGSTPNYMVLGITTPGYDLSSFAHDLYVRTKAGYDPDLFSQVYEPDDLECESDDRVAWAQSNPRLEDDPAFEDVIAKQHRTMPDHEFRRFRLGIWTSGETAWLPAGAWAGRATGEKLTYDTIGPRDEVWLGFDGSFSGDSTALVAALGTHVSVAGCWENPGRKGWRVPRGDVEETITMWMEAGRRVKLLVDPPYWTREISDWQARWPGRVIEFPTHVRTRMAPACTAFYAAVMDGTLTHDGDKRLARHVSNAIVKPTPQGDYITKPDPTSPAKIDLAVAAVVAFSASSVATRRRPGVFVA